VAELRFLVLPDFTSGVGHRDALDRLSVA
jgi:hypothetical protein